MNRPEGTVVAAGSGVVTVSVKAAAACARCRAGRGCGAGVLQKGRTRTIEAKVAPGLALASGDRVRLELAPEHLARAAWLAYGLPLVAMVAATGAGLIAIPSDSELAAVSSGAIGLAAGILWSRRLLSKDDCLQRISPTACEKIVEGAPQGSFPADAAR